MRAGSLRQLITLQSKTTTQDPPGSPTVAPDGAEIVTWVDRVMVPASVEPLRGREYFAAQEVQAETDTRVRIRYLAGIDTTWRVVWEGTIFDILSVIDVNGRHVEHQLMCRRLA